MKGKGTIQLIKNLRFIPLRFKVVLLCLTLILLSFFVIDLIFPVHTNILYSKLIYDSKGNLAHAYLSSDEKWRMNITIDEISPVLVKTIVYKEDKWFNYHPGVNVFAVFRAAWQNISRGERVSGASTITMQVIRMLEPRKRTHFNKFIEMIRALQLEMHHSKHEILLLYLNLLPYGGNIEGVKAASYIYFGQAPQALSTAQIITLAVIPNNPNHLKINAENSKIITERNQWIRQLSDEGIFTEQEAGDAMREPLQVDRYDVPRKIPHFSRYLSKIHMRTGSIKTFINPELQANVENLVSTEINRYRNLGITNCAVVVINNSTHTLEAYAGSAGFNEDMFQGQVDGVLALRSPGSTLKPFLFAQAIDEGLITPHTIVNDIPTNFSGFCPQNYDESFRGMIPAGDALALSLNLPAVDLLNRISVPRFTDKLSKGGLKWIGANRKKLGLSVVLGGCGVTLLELTHFYTCFANKGLLYPLRLCEYDEEQQPDTLFSEASSWMVTEILTGLKRPDLPTNFENSMNLPKIAWKTGTSYGRRDAWSIGYNPAYTVGVWVGNFDGKGVPELAGSDFAAPVLFKIFNYLIQHKSFPWYKIPAGVDFRLVCSESGLPPSDFCTNLITDYYIPGISPNKKCTHLVEVYTNADESMSYCRSCLPATGYKVDHYPNLPAEVITYYQEMNIPFRKIPPHNPECSRVMKDQNPVINSLSDGKEYILYKNASSQLQLSCTVSPDVNKVYWYINDSCIGEMNASGKLFFKPGEGINKISCSDDRGRNTDIRVKVKFF